MLDPAAALGLYEQVPRWLEMQRAGFGCAHTGL
jgi:hypothetical protein